MAPVLLVTRCVVCPPSPDISRVPVDKDTETLLKLLFSRVGSKFVTSSFLLLAMASNLVASCLSYKLELVTFPQEFTVTGDLSLSERSP